MFVPTPLGFLKFRLDPLRGQLYRGNAPIPLTPKAFAVLLHLAQSGGRLVTKQELLDDVWSGVFVGDAVLKSTMREVRKALGDDAGSPRFIETAHRRGYRFVAPVTGNRVREPGPALVEQDQPRHRREAGEEGRERELPGDDHLPFVGNQEEILSEIQRFISDAHVRPSSEHVLATVLTMIADARPEDTAHLERVFARDVSWHRGRIVAADGRRLVAMFDGPGRAVQCACSIVTVAERSGIAVRGGVHIGECDSSLPAGPVPDTSAALAEAAAPGEVLVSCTVVDLVPGSGLQFTERGALRIEAAGRDLAILIAGRRPGEALTTC